jgi:hypothetical protein
MSTAASLEYPAGVILLSFPLTLYHAAKRCHERRFDFVRCWGSEFLRDLTATFNQLAPPWTIVRIIVDGIEDRSGSMLSVLSDCLFHPQLMNHGRSTWKHLHSGNQSEVVL